MFGQEIHTAGLGNPAQTVLGRSILQWQRYLDNNLAERQSITKVWNDYINSSNEDKRTQGVNLRQQIHNEINSLKANVYDPDVYEFLPLKQLSDLIDTVQRDVDAINVGQVMNFGADALRKAPLWIVLNDLKKTLGERAIKKLQTQGALTNDGWNPGHGQGNQNTSPHLPDLNNEQDNTDVTDANTNNSNQAGFGSGKSILITAGLVVTALGLKKLFENFKNKKA